MAEIRFKASRRTSDSCHYYREILKEGDLVYDLTNSSDDVICLYTRDGTRIAIDCDKKTGEFRLFFDAENFKEYPVI